MQIVIDIDERGFRDIQRISTVQLKGRTPTLEQVIASGTPLPKGHGDLIDVNRKITVPVYDEQYEEWGEETLTVREALNRWSDEGITVKDVVILADKEQEDGND